MLYCREKKRGHQEGKQLCTHFNKLLLSPGQPGLLNCLCAGGSAESGYLLPHGLQHTCRALVYNRKTAAGHLDLFSGPVNQPFSRWEKSGWLLSGSWKCLVTHWAQRRSISVHAELCMQVTYFSGNTVVYCILLNRHMGEAFSFCNVGLFTLSLLPLYFACLWVMKPEHLATQVVSWVEVQMGLTEVIFRSHALGRKLFMKGCRVGMKNGRKEQLSLLCATGKPSSAGCS